VLVEEALVSVEAAPVQEHQIMVAILHLAQSLLLAAAVQEQEVMVLLVVLVVVLVAVTHLTINQAAQVTHHQQVRLKEIMAARALPAAMLVAVEVVQVVQAEQLQMDLVLVNLAAQ
jgi:hypothetical protein